jgi:hypothetical protein
MANPRRAVARGHHTGAGGPATRIGSYPVRVGGHWLVNKMDRPVGATTKDVKFPQSFAFAGTARDGYYMPGHQAHQNVYLTAGRLAAGVSPSAAVQDYLGEFQGQEVHLTAEPAGPLAGVVKCWVKTVGRDRTYVVTYTGRHVSCERGAEAAGKAEGSAASAGIAPAGQLAGQAAAAAALAAVASSSTVR